MTGADGGRAEVGTGASREVAEVLARLEVPWRTVHVLKEVPDGNSSWLVRAAGPVVLRRYHDRATVEDLAYEHAVLAHAASAGWVVPDALSDLLEHDGRLYGLNRFVPGTAVGGEVPAEQQRRGRDLARLHMSLRGLEAEVGQRVGWRSQHEGVSHHDDIDWDAGLRAARASHPDLADWAEAAAHDAHSALQAAGASELEALVVHGDFAEWNVHYTRGQLSGVVDFGLTHLDTRPYELAMARAHRAPHMTDGYRDELVRHGWPLLAVEEACIAPIDRAFRVQMTAWQLDEGRRSGTFDVAMIERQLERTGTPRP